ncbi:MAG: hypothetical protein GY898_03500 [Proteobacteria bacterium]|nr:hypothetical protein [Pseudomonadota bacterium]
MTAPRLLVLLLALTLMACGPSRRGGGGDDDDSGGPGDDDDDTPDDDDDDTSDDDDQIGEDCDSPGETDCLGQNYVICTEGTWQLVETCASPTPICHDQLGCLLCDPGSTYCEGDDVLECLEDGQSTILAEECDDDESCVAGECWGACENAEAQLSYLGCHFMAVPTLNQWLAADFANDFGVVIGNPDDDPAEITVRRGSSVITTAVIPAGQTQALELAYEPTLQTSATSSVTVPIGAYEVESNIPVAAYQYNPLHYFAGFANSYTNDASMLLPEHVLTGSYMVGGWPTWGSDLTESWSPGFVAIVGTVDGTTVDLDSTAYTASGSPGAVAPGGSTSFTLNRGDVAQIVTRSASSGADAWCSSQGYPTDGTHCWDLEADLTGSVIAATEPVAVISGHGCTYMPYNLGACDHVEEMALPTETWGTQTVMSAVRLPAGSGLANSIYRVMALNDGTNISFDPAVASPVTLNAGEYFQFDSAADFVVDASNQMFVWQGVMGAEANGGGTDGDPAMGSGIPRLQWRTRYDFLVPDSYETNFINVVIEDGTGVDLDGVPITDFDEIDPTGFLVARVPLSAGSHVIEGTAAFSITAYGYGDWTSYLYPGGMNLSR